MSVQEWCSGDEAMVPGALRGYRMWNVSLEHGLSATYSGHGGWGADGTITAECRRGPSFNVWLNEPPAKAPEPHEAPAEGCGCGVYGWYRPNDTRLHAGDLFGVIEATGRILLGDFGFRAQRARVVALAIPGGSWARDRLREEWAAKGVAVFDDQAALLAAFPPDDVTTLLGREIPEDPPEAAGVWGNVTFSVSKQMMQDFIRQMSATSQQTQTMFAHYGRDIRQAAARLSALQAASEPPVPDGPKERALALRKKRNTGPAHEAFRSRGRHGR